MSPDERATPPGDRPVLAAGEVRALCRTLVQRLDLRPPLDPEILCRRLGDSRGRPISLVARPIRTGLPSGLLLSLDDSDVIVYQATTTAAHQRHIIFHEVFHLVREGPPDGDSDECEALTGPPTAAGGVYGDPREWEAETAATILSGWSGRTDVAPSTHDDDAARRLGAALGRTWDWL